MRVWRDHPILSTALVGALIGSLVAVIFLLTDPMLTFSSRLLLYLFPISILGFGFNGGSIAFSIFLAVVEVGGNAVLYSCTSTAPVGLAIATCRPFGTQEGPGHSTLTA